MERHIALVDDWDVQPEIGKSGGHHVTRERERSILLDFFLRRSGGSLLVCGSRGVGKTSSIFAAINEAKESRPQLEPVLIKATSIHFGKQKEKESVLKHLIGSCYAQVTGTDADKELEDLYKHSNASKIVEVRSSDQQKEVRTSLKTRVDISAFILVFLGVIMGAMSLYQELQSYSWLLTVIALSSGIGFLAYYHKITKKKSSESTHRDEVRQYDFAALQYDFENLLDSLSSEHKILFILDEFDKIDDPLKTIIDLKMLLNQSNALFVFVSTPDILNRLQKPSMGYTLFSQKLFLKRPLFKEMELFIDEITEPQSKEIRNELCYRHLKNYLCYLSHTDFFELYNVIRDHTVYKNNKPCLSLDLEPHQITQANLQECIGFMYEHKKRDNPSLWQLNDSMLDWLYSAVEKLEKSPKSQHVVIDNNGIQVGDQSLIANVDEARSDQDISKMFKSLLQDLLVLLASQGYLSRISDNEYSVVRSLPEYKAAPSGIFFEEQRVFIQAFEEFRRDIIHFGNLHYRWVEDLGRPFTVDNIESKWEALGVNMSNYFALDVCSEAKNLYMELKSANRLLIPSEELVSQTYDIRSIRDSLDRHSLTLLANILEMQLKMRITVIAEDTSHSLLSGFSEKYSFPNATLSFPNDDREIYVIHIVLFPSPKFLLDAKALGLSNHIIIALGNEELLASYTRHKNINTKPSQLDREIKALADLEIPSILYALKLPLQEDLLEKLVRCLKKIPLKD